MPEIARNGGAARVVPWVPDIDRDELERRVGMLNVFLAPPNVTRIHVCSSVGLNRTQTVDDPDGEPTDSAADIQEPRRGSEPEGMDQSVGFATSGREEVGVVREHRTAQTECLRGESDPAAAHPYRAPAVELYPNAIGANGGKSSRIGLEHSDEDWL